MIFDHKPGRKASNEAETLIENNFIQLNIDEIDTFHCLKCGSTDLKHKCYYLKIQKITENIDFDTSQFYIKYLNGEFIPQIKLIIENNLELNENQRELMNQFMKEFPNGEPFESLENFLKKCSETVYSDIEKRMKKIEKDSMDFMYNESMLI